MKFIATQNAKKKFISTQNIEEMSLAIGNATAISFKNNSQSWSSYWATRFPSALTATVVSASQIDLAWTNNGTGWDNVRIERSTDGITFAEVTSVVSSSVSYSNTGLTSSKNYYYRIRYLKSGNYSSYSNIDYAETSAHANLVAGWKFDDPKYWGNALSDYGIAQLSHSPGVYYNGKTYIAYQGDNDDPYIITYTHSSGTWSAPVKVGTNPLANGDGHGQPVLFFDASGYIHVMFGSHATDIYYSKSNDPEDISDWTAQSSPANGTYPQIIQFSTGVIYLFYRDQNTTEDWGYRTSSDSGGTWSAFTKICDNIDYFTFRKGTGDNIHAVGFSHNEVLLDRQDIFYLYYNGTNWLKSDGTTATLPVDGSTTDVLIYDSGSDYIPSASIDIDANNKPIIFFTEGGILQVADYNFRILRYVNSAWGKVNVGVKTGNWRNFANAINYISSSRIEIVVIEDTADIGGDLYLYVSTDSGATWKNERKLMSGRFIDPCFVKDYDDDVKLVMCEYAASAGTWTRKVYLWGDSGIVDGSIANIGTVCLDIKGANNGTLTNSPTSIAGKFGKGLSFASASSQYVDLSDDDVFSFITGSPDHAFSLTMWVNVASTNQTGMLLSKFGADPDSEWMFFIATNKLQANIDLADGSHAIYAQGPFTSTGAWKFLCFTYDGAGLAAGMKIYVDCIEVQDTQVEDALYTGMTNGAAKLLIAGRDVSGGEYYLNGSMDEVKIWDKVLSGAEMTAEMANTL